jgi:beta-glucosidase
MTGFRQSVRGEVFEMSIRKVVFTVVGFVGVGVLLVGAGVAQKPKPVDGPWMNTALSADARADLMVKAMTLDEKIQMVHGSGWGVLRDGDPVAARNNHGAGFVPGVDRLGLPDIQLADSAVGVRGTARDGRYSTLLPSVIGMTASWDPAMGHLYGDVIGRELRDLGFNMSIGGGVDLIREPRNGRNFEYASEDPLLAGIMVGNLAMGVQSNQVMGDIKHYVLNDQETGRNTLNAILNKRAMQETDLLAFQIAIKMAKPAGVMCSYNRVNGDYACENDYTLGVLKKDWGFEGWVLSDWEGTHSTVKAALAGLDMEQPGETYFGPALKQAVLDGKVPEARVDDMVHRIVRSMFVNGVIDNPPKRRVVDPFKGRDDAQAIEEKSIVLLKNEGGILPLNAAKVKTIAVIGGHADMGVMSGGGSAQVDAPGGHVGGEPWDSIVYFPSSPLRYVKEAAPEAVVTFDDGLDAAKAASAAKGAGVVLLFVTKWQSEGQDSLTSSLPNKQDELVAAVAAANPKTIVVLETGGPVTVPWVGSVKGIIESWYPGIGGGEAIANVLFGKVNPSGKLPVTFTASDEDLPHPHVAGLTARTGAGSADGNAGGEQAKDFPVDYNVEGMMVGYKWFEAKGKTPLFPFGFGLSYTSFAYSGLKVAPGSVSFEVKNTGKVAGDEIAEVYVTLPTVAGEPFKKLAGFTRVSLALGEKKMVTVELNPLVLSVFSVEKNAFERVGGEMKVEVGGSVVDLPLKGMVAAK